MKKHLNITLLILTSIVVHITTSCSHQPDSYLASDIRIYKNSEVWELAQCVEKDDTVCIKQIINDHTEYLNFQEPKFGFTLLEWAVYNGRVKAIRQLVELGANPNTQSHKGTSPFIRACAGYETSEYAKLMYEHGGDVNAVANFDGGQPLRTPLIAASMARLETVKFLVSKGAKIDFFHRDSQDALTAAIDADNMKIAYWLITEGNARINRVYGKNLQDVSIDIPYKLRRIAYKLDSENYEYKMKIVEFIESKGPDYKNEPIPKHLKEQLDSAYLEVY